MVAFGGKLLLAMYGSHSGASRLSAVWRLSAFWRVRYRRFHCIYIRPKKHFKNEKRSKNAAAKKRPNTSGVGKIHNYYEDIYIPPYNNTD